MLQFVIHGVRIQLVAGVCVGHWGLSNRRWLPIPLVNAVCLLAAHWQNVTHSCQSDVLN